MREECPEEGSPRHIFVAGVVTSSFDPVSKHMLPMLEMHDPVPQYAEDLHASMGRVFATLKKPVWRANFAVAEWRDEEEASSEDDDALLQRLYLKVEYETLRRLPKHPEYLVFTIRSHMDPLLELASMPLACAALEEEIRLLPEALLQYKGIGEPTTKAAVLRFLDKVSAAQLSG
ncbi:unnamed protein product [Polarella glacialis]|uniref:Uncharacterized protein n=2 Tax=Polarella glacialis TaxID=89957 RepID=A0A813HZN5_POLGL|nr:unnamed protein product [Polarella glacialis]